MDYDHSDIPSAYDAGREISQHKKHQALKFFAENLPVDEITNIVDLGCGTGRFSGALTEYFDASVVGIDPSEKMLAKASAKYNGETIRFEQAGAERLPLVENSADMIFMSMVLHHLLNPKQTARECYRILKKDATVCIRNTFINEISTYPYLDIFPSIRSIIESQLISREQLINTHRSTGFELLAHQTAWEEISPSWQAFADKIALKADSFVARLDDKEFQSGLFALQNKAQDDDNESPVGLNVDSFIFKKCK